jgi:hypothetical protein
MLLSQFEYASAARGSRAICFLGIFVFVSVVLDVVKSKVQSQQRFLVFNLGVGGLPRERNPDSRYKALSR